MSGQAEIGGFSMYVKSNPRPVSSFKQILQILALVRSGKLGKNVQIKFYVDTPHCSIEDSLYQFSVGGLPTAQDICSECDNRICEKRQLHFLIEGHISDLKTFNSLLG